MLVQCPQCSAAYEFPAERLPEGGLRAKCARCGCVMRVHRPGPKGRAEVERLQGRRRPGRALSATASAGVDANLTEEVVRPDADTPPPDPVPAETDPERLEAISSHTDRREVDAEDEPSIIVDMGQFNEVSAEESSSPPAEVVLEPGAFTPFGAPASAEARRRMQPEDVAVTFPDDQPVDRELAASIRPRPVGRMILALLVLLSAGFVFFVAWRNHWGPVWKDPATAVRVALGLPTAPPPRTQAPIVQTPTLGELRVRDVALEWLDRGAAIVRGRVVNESDRIQQAIGLDVAVLRDGLAVRSRVVPCCSALQPDEARSVARDPGHPHFDEAQRTGDARLAPGEAKVFTAVVRGLPIKARDALQPRVVIKYSEAERVAPNR